MTCKSSRTMTVLVAAGALAAAGCGGDDKPAAAPVASAASQVEQPTGTPAKASVRGNGVDRALVTAMVAHHRSAVAMARIARQRGTSPFVKGLARDVVTTQTREIATMRREDKSLELAGIKRGSLGLPAAGKSTGADARTLQTARPFDPAFLRTMLVHHQGAIEIARVEVAKGRDPQLRTLASTIISTHKREIRGIREQLGTPADQSTRPVPPIGERDPRSGSPDMPGVDDTTGLPPQTE